MRTQWTYEEVTHLYTARKAGMRVKVIARLLGRTESATNKALRRYGIKLKFNKTLAQPSFRSFVPIPLKNLSRTRKIPVSEVSFPTVQPDFTPLLAKGEKIQKRRKSLHGEPWVSMKDVISWLTAEGITIYKGEENTHYSRQFPYILMGKRHSGPQVLIFANQKRFDQGLEPFLAEDVTRN